ncbi:MAG: UDP-galactose transporter [Phylliscum demangeonii]|nr:MAG: UDP-galactose transporter [Phylliscum demangeonii]
MARPKPATAATPAAVAGFSNSAVRVRQVQAQHAQELEDHNHAHGHAHGHAPPRAAGRTELLVCVAGIYASFLSWAVLQERITTTPYADRASGSGAGSASASASASAAAELFRYPIFLNTLQSTLAFATGYVYLFLTTFGSGGGGGGGGRGHGHGLVRRQVVGPLALVALTSSLASPFGYASLAHVDYITFLLAKACKLLPVMLLHLTVFRTPYPRSKYAVVGLVTAGVALFTLQSHRSRVSSSSSMASTKKDAPLSSSSPASNDHNRMLGLALLAVNLLLDGVTNSTQDYVFRATQPAITGPQMMVVLNLFSTMLTTAYMFLGPALLRFVAPLGLLPPTTPAADEFAAATAFLRRHPAAARDVLAFALCGAIGQIFIYYTLAHFSSLLLTTVTVTRKMLTMVLSVLWFGHRLSLGQWAGVALVFAGVAAEGWVQQRAKREKEMEREGWEREREGVAEVLPAKKRF